MWGTPLRREGSAGGAGSSSGRANASSRGADFAHAFSHEYSLDREDDDDDDDEDDDALLDAHEHEADEQGPRVASSLLGGTGLSPPSSSSGVQSASPASVMTRATSSDAQEGSTADSESRRHIVNIPRHLTFAANGAATGGAERCFQQSAGGTAWHAKVDEEDEETAAEAATMATEMRSQREVTTEAGDSGERSALLGFGGEAHAARAHRLHVDAEGRARRARNARILAQQQQASQAPPQPAAHISSDTLDEFVATPTPGLLFPHDYHHFTPQTRRTYLRQQIDVSRLAHARARRRCCWIFASNPLTPRRLMVASLLLSISLASASEQVLRKIVLGNMYNYRWFIFEFVAILTFILVSLMSLFHVEAIRHFLKHHGMPWRFLLVSSFLDAVHSVSLVLAIGVLPPSWGVILPQVLIPMALLFRFFATDGERVGRFGALGSLLLLSGAACLVVPELVAYSGCNGMKSSRSDLRAELLGNIVILLVGALIPGAASSIYKQRYLQRKSMNVYVMNIALAAGQIVWGMILAPVAIELQFLMNSGVQQHAHVRADLTGGNGGIVSDGSGNLDTSSIPPFSAPHSLTNEELSWTNSVSRNLLVNFREGWNCVIMGRNSEVGDTCEQMYPALLIQFCLLLASTLALQLLLQFFMRRSGREHLLASALSMGSLCALGLFNLSWIHSFLPAWDLGDCIPPWDSTSFVAVAAVVGGAIVAQWEPSQQPLDLDVWARLEELTQLEELELQARRAKQGARGRSQHSQRR